MQVTSTVEGSRAVVTASGELDVATAPELRAYLHKIVDEGASTLIVDLSDVGFLDSTTLGVLISVHKRLAEAGGVVELVIPHARLLRIFQITGLDRVFTIHSSLTAAAQ
ncbi:MULTISPECIES: STAS domain-containing protein [Dactylosporangium]|uniref:Anti-sigma factor antagonist n=2 Tax=Dactylosporangium TaxID=35753 RepID=A0A9W6KS48_9ACTN|nr:MULTISPECIES: STAS domain-containing protein [Dactylosporangium]UAB93467.1 STAS domain-containing protein [Dactylosporangium vinaceum]UWZ41849.1 STAS domain-containing protein [Dactylosporangium matsuzakiense]GLL04494.1 anti-sigma factor antagonist [Dactylosporangium matsuzakiense]